MTMLHHYTGEHNEQPCSTCGSSEYDNTHLPFRIVPMSDDESAGEVARLLEIYLHGQRAVIWRRAAEQLAQTAAHDFLVNWRRT